MATKHDWANLPHIDNNEVFEIIAEINKKKVTPQELYDRLHGSNHYLNAEQLRHIQEGCADLYSDYSLWYRYDHALCSRVTDRWNLKDKFGAEGYYYCSEKYAKDHSKPPLNWKPMNQSLQMPMW